MLLAASSSGGSASLHGARGLHQLRRGADGCVAGTRARERRSGLARTPAEILVADLNRPARGRHGRGHGFGFRQDGVTMFLHCWSVRALRLRKAPRDALSRAILLIALSLLVATSSAHGAPGKRADKIGDVDTEHMFGF